MAQTGGSNGEAMAKSLTPKQIKFCDHYLACGNASEAVRLAGYQTKYPDAIGSQLLRKTIVSDYIKAYSQNEHELLIVSVKERQHILSEIAGDEEEVPAIRIKAIDTLNKMTGEYLNRTELSGSLNVPVIIDDIPSDA
jgi:phage terminase small subunit